MLFRSPGATSDRISLADLGVSMNAFAVYFDPLGIPYHFVDEDNDDNNNPITPGNPRTITISAGSESYTLTVTPETGFITTQ